MIELSSANPSSDTSTECAVEPWRVSGIEVTTVAREEGLRAPFRLFVTTPALEFAGAAMPNGGCDPTALVRATIAAIRGHIPVRKARKGGADLRAFRVSGLITGVEASDRVHLKLLPDKVFLVALQQEPFEAN